MTWVPSADPRAHEQYNHHVSLHSGRGGAAFDAAFSGLVSKQMEQELQLTKQLKALEHYGPICIWDDSRLIPGKRWLPGILEVIDKCHLAVLMLSSDYVDRHGFIMQIELPHILGREKADTLQILPVVARPYDIGAVPLLSERQLWDSSGAIWPREDCEAEQTLAQLTQRSARCFSLRTGPRAADASMNGAIPRGQRRWRVSPSSIAHYRMGYTGHTWILRPKLCGGRSSRQS